jgi:hypothetical protein
MEQLNSAKTFAETIVPDAIQVLRNACWEKQNARAADFSASGVVGLASQCVTGEITTSGR